MASPSPEWSGSTPSEGKPPAAPTSGKHPTQSPGPPRSSLDEQPGGETHTSHPIPSPVPSPSAPTITSVPISSGSGKSPSLPVTPQPFPQRLGQFEVRRYLGEGAFGRVYEAYDTSLRRAVALKVAKPEQVGTPERIERFLREARAAAALTHPNIVGVFESGRDGPYLYIATSFVEGRSLEREMAALPDDQPMTPERAAEVARKLAEALAYAHKQGIVHRDVKPANVLVREDGEPLLADFGLAARADEPRLTRADGRGPGTPEFMSPEQWRGDVAPGSDQYSLGCLLYEMLTGRLPFVGKYPDHLMFLHLNQAPPPPRTVRPGVPVDLEKICLKCLEKDTARRYADCQELADDLRRWRDGEAVLARRAGPVERVMMWARREPGWAATALLALVVLVGAVAVPFLWVAQQASNKEREAREKEEEVRVKLGESYQARCNGLFDRAAADAEEAEGLEDGDPKARGIWTKVVSDLQDAFHLIAEAGLTDLPSQKEAMELLTLAQQRIADADKWVDSEPLLARLKEHHDDAVFFGSLAVGLDLAECRDRTKSAVDNALKIPLASFKGKKADSARDLRHEVLLMHAHALSRLQLGEPDKGKRERLNLALARLDEADELLARRQTRGSLMLRARCLKALGRADAERVGQQAAKMDDRLDSDHYLRGLEAYQRGERGDYRRALTSFFRVKAGHFGAQYLKAACRLHERLPQEARAELEICVAQRPKFVWPHLLLGFAEMELNNYDPARRHFEQALELANDRGTRYVVRINRGLLAQMQRRWKEAEVELEAAIRERQDAAPAYLNLAVAHRQRGDSLIGETAMLALSQGGGLAYLAAEAQRLQAYKDATATLSLAIPRLADSARLPLYRERGQLYLLLHDAGQAQLDFENALALPQQGESGAARADDLMQLGRLLHRAGKHGEAARRFQQALECKPPPAEAHRLLAAPLLAMKLNREAGESLDRYLNLMQATGRARTPAENALIAETLGARGAVHAQLGELVQARNCYTQALGVSPNPRLLLLRGWSYLQERAATQAEADFTAAAGQQSELGEAYVGRATARIRLGRPQSALEDVERWARLGPETDRLLFAAARVYALAAAEAGEATGKNTSLASARYDRQAVRLLGRALEERKTEDRRRDFWREVLEPEPALGRVLWHGELQKWAEKYATRKKAEELRLETLK